MKFNVYARHKVSRKKKQYIVISTFVTVLLSSFLLVGNFEVIDAQEMSKENVNAEGLYDVQITLIDISDIDYANGGYSLSFWITLTSDEIGIAEELPFAIDYVNGKIDAIEHEYVTDNSYSAKVHGTFYTNMDFHNYPLMSLSLPIIIEPIQFETHEIKFVDYTDSDVDLELTVAGLIFQNVEEEIIEHTYGDGDIFSRYIVTYHFETPLLTSFLVGIFPIVVMAFLVIFLFGIDPRNHDIKIEMVIGVLIAAVFFHVLDVGQALPPLEYLTLEDKAMTVLYSMLGVIMIETLAQRKWNEENDIDKAKKIDRKFLIVFIVVAIAVGLSVSQL